MSELNILLELAIPLLKVNGSLIAYKVFDNEDEIKKAQKTVLLPCEHMFHWNCCHTWLKQNNTCPVCRLELN